MRNYRFALYISITDSWYRLWCRWICRCVIWNITFLAWHMYSDISTIGDFQGLLNRKSTVVRVSTLTVKSFGCKASSAYFCHPLENEHGPFVYRLGHLPFTEERRVRFPYGLQSLTSRGTFYFCCTAACKYSHTMVIC
jgi:hypothetical protein